MVRCAQVEAQFTICNITKERTKFDHVVASLAPLYATEVRDLLLAPSEGDPYYTLKAQLIQCAQLLKATPYLTTTHYKGAG